MKSLREEWAELNLLHPTKFPTYEEFTKNWVINPIKLTIDTRGPLVVVLAGFNVLGRFHNVGDATEFITIEGY